MSDKDYLIKGEMYQYNLGWLIKELMSFKQDLATAIDLKTIKYADPIQWDITTQYPANTVVVDPKSGTAYMSKVPVPAGVELTNTNYWVVVFNYQDIYNKIMDGVAFNDKDKDYATKDLLVNDLVWYAGNLYRVTRAIPTGSKYIPGTNLIATTIESLLARYYGRDRTAQVSNDTVNVSGDFTLVAGDIAETANNIKLHSTKDMLFDSDGKLTEQIAGNREINVDGNDSVQITGNREIDVDGNDSVQIKGVSTVNVTGLRTEVYSWDKTERVTGAYTGKFGSASLETGAQTFPVQFPTKTVDLAWIKKSEVTYVTDYGAKGDGVTDDSQAFINAVANRGLIIVPPGKYRITKPITLQSNTILTGCGGSVLLIDGAVPTINIWSAGMVYHDVTNIRITNLELTLHPNATTGSGISIVQNYQENVTMQSAIANIYLDHLYIHDINDRGINTFGGGIGSKRKHGYPEIYIDRCVLERCKGSIINSSVIVKITNCYIKYNKGGGGEAISIDNGCIYSVISNCTFDQNDGGAGAISTDETEFLRIDRCAFVDNMVTHIKLNLQSGNCDSVMIRDNYMIGIQNAIACTTTTAFTANNMQVTNNRSLSPISVNGMRGDAFTGNSFGDGTFTDADATYLFNNFVKTDLTHTFNNPFTFKAGFSDPGLRSKIIIKNGVIEQVILFAQKNTTWAEGDIPCTCLINLTDGIEFSSPYVTYTQTVDKTVTAVFNTLEVLSRINSLQVYGVTNYKSNMISIAF